MPRTLLVNQVNGTKKTYALPVDPVGAQTFAEAMLEGEYAIYKSEGKSGSDVVTVAPTMISVAFWNDANPRNRGYGSFVLPATKTENDLFAVLIGKTLNGILIDQVSTMKQSICEKF